jgi:hypothetical protein
MNLPALLAGLIEKAGPAIVSAAAPSIGKALVALFRGDEAAAAKHARIGAQKVAAKLALRVKR